MGCLLKFFTTYLSVRVALWFSAASVSRPPMWVSACKVVRALSVVSVGRWLADGDVVVCRLPSALLVPVGCSGSRPPGGVASGGLVSLRCSSGAPARRPAGALNCPSEVWALCPLSACCRWFSSRRYSPASLASEVWASCPLSACFRWFCSRRFACFSRLCSICWSARLGIPRCGP